jgi:poly-gamma-glutamate synthesis protein (capsule biosynthesis protein)
MIHWGSEYKYYEPSEIQVTTAHKLLEGGVDVIFGHHPHVLQKAEWYETEDGRKTLVAYSLGNFISNQSRKYHPIDGDTEDAYTRDGVIMEITIENDAQLTKKTNMVIKKFRVVPVWTVNNWHEWTYNGNCGDPIHSWNPKCWETWQNNENRGEREIYTIPLEKKMVELQQKLESDDSNQKIKENTGKNLELYKLRHKVISNIYKDI